MNQNVIVKSYPNGIKIHMSNDVSIDEILKEIKSKFINSGDFFKNAKIALAFDGRELTDGEELQIVNTIQMNSEVQIVCIVGKDEKTNQTFTKALNMVSSGNDNDENIGRFYRGNLRKGQMLETESSLVIIGDIHPGATVISAKDIIIIGGLYGAAYAGGDGNLKHFVAALEMSPERLKIGDLKYQSKEKPKWSIIQKFHPKIACIKNKQVITEPITKELLSEIIL